MSDTSNYYDPSKSQDNLADELFDLLRLAERAGNRFGMRYRQPVANWPAAEQSWFAEAISSGRYMKATQRIVGSVNAHGANMSSLSSFEVEVEGRRPNKPFHFFKSINEVDLLREQPESIEFLNCVTGETYIHTGGTAFWDNKTNSLNVDSLALSGITHWRVKRL